METAHDSTSSLAFSREYVEELLKRLQDAPDPDHASSVVNELRNYASGLNVPGPDMVKLERWCDQIISEKKFTVISWEGVDEDLPALLSQYQIKTTVSFAMPMVSLAIHLLGAFAIFFVTGLLTTPTTVSTLCPACSAHDTVLYFHGQLPAIDDSAGASAGSSGRSGGSEALADQAIKVNRHPEVKDTVVDAKAIHLPASVKPPENMIAVSGTTPHTLSRLIHDLMLDTPAAPKLQAEAPVIKPAVRPSPLKLPQEPFAPSTTASTLALPIVVPQDDVAKVLKPRLTVPVAPPSDHVVMDQRQSIPQLVGQQESHSQVTTPSLWEPIHPASKTPSESAPDAPSQAAALLSMKPDMMDVIVSARPDRVVGVPAGQSGSIAMSPKGTKTLGKSGAGNGSGTLSGSGAGSGNAELGHFGSGKSGDGYGATSVMIGGMGAKNGAAGIGNGSGPSTGLSVGGSTVSLGSFGGRNTASHSKLHTAKDGSKGAPTIVVIASAKTGGGLSHDLAPNGNRVYTVYLPTRLGAAVFQYADPRSDSVIDADLTAPEAINTDLPADLKKTRMVLACTMDREGTLHGFRVVRTEDPETTAAILAALAHWRFTPVLRDQKALPVNVMIGFGIDTD